MDIKLDSRAMMAKEFAKKCVDSFKVFVLLILKTSFLNDARYEDRQFELALIFRPFLNILANFL